MQIEPVPPRISDGHWNGKATIDYCPPIRGRLDGGVETGYRAAAEVIAALR